MRPPCAGKWRLFDSTDPADHIEAREICAACPLIEDCRRRLEQANVSARAVARGGGPRGTWAGELVGHDSRYSRRFEQYLGRKAAS